MLILNYPLISKRLVLRPLENSDFNYYRHLVLTPGIARGAHFHLPKNNRELDLMFNDDLKHAVSSAVILRRPKRWLGLVSLYPQIGEHLEPSFRILGLGYMLMTKYQRHGYMTEALSGLITNLDRLHTVRQLRAVTFSNNYGSIAVLTQNRFVTYHEIFDMVNFQTRLLYQLNL